MTLTNGARAKQPPISDISDPNRLSPAPFAGTFRHDTITSGEPSANPSGVTHHCPEGRPCGITVQGTTSPGMIRHLSTTGAQIETVQHLSVGDEVHYFWDGLPPLRARVAWQCDGLVGLRNLPPEANPTVVARLPRSLRISCRLPARADRGNDTFKAVVGNISQRGLLIYGLPAMEVGTRFDISVCGQRFSDVEVRWSRGGCTGVSLAAEIKYETISALVELAEYDEAGRRPDAAPYSADLSDGTARPFEANVASASVRR